MDKKKIAILAYASGPQKGSEFRLGWNLPRELSLFGYDITVFVGSSDGELGFFEDLKSALKQEHSELTYVMLYPNIIMRFVNFFNINLGMSWMFYLALYLWNRGVLKYINKRGLKFDITHQLNPHGFRVPGHLWKLEGSKHVWGPIGGAQLFPIDLAVNPSFTEVILIRLKNIMNKFNLNSSRVRAAIFHSDMLTFSTKSNLSIFNMKFGVDGAIISDQACDYLPDQYTSGDGSFIMVGSIDLRKNVEFLCLVFSQLDLKLHVVGSGRKLSMLKTKFEPFENIIFHGYLDRSAVQQLMARSSFGLIPSLVEGNSAVTYEFIQNSCIVLANRRDGFVTELPEECLIDNSRRDLMYEAWKARVQMFSKMNFEEKEGIWIKSAHRKTWRDMAEKYDIIYREILNLS